MPKRPKDPRPNRFDDYNKNRVRNKDDIIESPEEYQDDPYGTLNTRQQIHLKGEDKPRTLHEEITTEDDDGNFTVGKIIHLNHDVTGRIIRQGEIVGRSWTGLKIPHGYLYSCANPYFDHPEIRNVYLGLDGHVAIATGYILCKPCFLKNKAKHDLKKLVNWTPLRWFYNPDLY